MTVTFSSHNITILLKYYHQFILKDTCILFYSNLDFCFLVPASQAESSSRSSGKKEYDTYTKNASLKLKISVQQILLIINPIT